jgi:hypothetical protein
VSDRTAWTARIYREHAAELRHNATPIPCAIDRGRCFRADCAELGCALVADPVHGRLLSPAGLVAFAALEREEAIDRVAAALGAQADAQVLPMLGNEDGTP